MNEKYARQMKKGMIEMLVLKLLSENQMYGYKLISELKERSKDVFVLKEGTLYPVLYRLEEEELVKSEWGKAQGRQVARKYYEITPKGMEALQEITEVWLNIKNGINYIMEE